jgi:hypothetical protein
MNVPPLPIPYGMNPLMMYPSAASAQMLMCNPMTQQMTMPGFDDHQQQQLHPAVPVPPASVKPPRLIVNIEVTVSSIMG